VGGDASVGEDASLEASRNGARRRRPRVPYGRMTGSYRQACRAVRGVPLPFDRGMVSRCSVVAPLAAVEPPAPPVSGRIRARALVLGLVLTPFNVLFVVAASLLQGGFRFTGRHSLFVNAIAALFVLVLGNRVLQSRWPRWALRRAELLLVYTMLATSTGLASSAFDWGGSLAATITYPARFATPENRWAQRVIPHLPTWLTVQDRDALAGFFEGGQDPYTPAFVHAWVSPALWYTAFVAVVLIGCLCLSSIVRRRWEDEEKLPYPMVQLPIAMAEERGEIFRNRLWWVGVGISVAVGLWGALQRFLPMLPALPLAADLSSYFRNRPPWDNLPWMSLEWQPFALGLCYLIPLDLAFSLFAFDLLWLAEYVLVGHLGWTASANANFPYGHEQVAGGVFALLLTVLWLDRRYLARVLADAVSLRSRPRQAEVEALTHRTALLGVVACYAFIYWFLRRGGMEAWVAFAYPALGFAVLMTVARIRVQLGPPAHQLGLSMPNWIIPIVTGTRALTPGTLGMFALLTPVIGQEQRNCPVPLQLEAFRMVPGGRGERRRVALALVLTPVLGMLAYFWASIHVGYHVGFANPAIPEYPFLAMARGNIASFSAALEFPTGTDRYACSAIGLGFALTLLLYWAKLALPWWPLHPVAFPIALSSTIQSMTLAIFATWLLKALLLRYGGLRSHQRVLPLFLGMLAGGALEATLRRVLSLVFGIDLSFMGT